MGGRRSNQAIKAGSLLKTKAYCHESGFQSSVRAGDFVLSLEDDNDFKLYIKVLHCGDTKWITKDLLVCVDT